MKLDFIKITKGKYMNKFYFFSLFFLMVKLGVTAQAFQNEFSGDEHIDMVIVTEDMFDLITEIDSDDKTEMKSFFGQLKYLANFATENPVASNKINLSVNRRIRSQGFKLLTKIKDERKDAVLYYIPAGRRGYAKELLLLINYSNGKTTLLVVKGNINMRRISLLALQTTQLDPELLKQAEKSVP